MEGGNDKLVEAAKIKLEGNDFFRSGKFEDARRHYNQVLDLLTSQTSLTNGEKEKRDNLVLTAHLNLAACELKLGDSVKIIEHCSLALQMDKESIKAYFRRGQAHHNNKDYDLALKDYLEAQRLEPQNAEIRKQKEKLLADKMEACARVGDQETLDGASEEDCHEMVVMYEDDEEAELRDYEKQCRKSARHNEYIPVSQFCLEYLPEQYRTETMLACVKALIASTVLLSVRGCSSKRPEFVPRTTIRYPFSSQSYRDRRRVGTGSIAVVWIYPEEGNEVCPCDTCKRSGKPKRHFARVIVVTATHVIFDITEGRNSTCYIDYDDDQITRNSCLKLATAVEVDSGVKDDTSSVHFVTHDLQLAEKLNERCQTYERLCQQMKYDLRLIQDDDEGQMELSVKISNLYEKREEALQKLSQVIDSMKAIINGDAKQMWEDYIRKYNLKPGDEIQSIYGRCLFFKANGGNKPEELIRYLSQAYEQNVRNGYEIRWVKDNFDSLLDQNGYEWILERYRLYRTDVVAMNKLLRDFLIRPDDIKTNDKNDDEHHDGEFYNSSHPFTVIVSHPHGLAKKVSLGEVTERNVALEDNFSSYRYTNTTCPGSSGAPVYITGKAGFGTTTHPHSKMVQVQRSQSAFCVDP